MSKKVIAPDLLARFKELHKGRTPHQTWDEKRVLMEIANKEELEQLMADEKTKKTEDKPEKKKELKPVNSSLFIPSSGENVKGRTVLREDWTDAHTAEYKESYKDRLKKAMKKLK